MSTTQTNDSSYIEMLGEIRAFINECFSQEPAVPFEQFRSGVARIISRYPSSVRQAAQARLKK